MLRLGEREKEIAKEKFYVAQKSIKNLDVNVDDIVNSKLVKTKSNSKYFIGITFHKAITILDRKTFKVKKGDKDKNNKLLLCIDDKLWEKYKAFSTKVEDLQNILNALLVYNDIYI